MAGSMENMSLVAIIVAAVIVLIIVIMAVNSGKKKKKSEAASGFRSSVSAGMTGSAGTSGPRIHPGTGGTAGPAASAGSGSGPGPSSSPLHRGGKMPGPNDQILGREISPVYVYRDNRRVWVCPDCEGENSEDEMICCICGRRR